MDTIKYEEEKQDDSRQRGASAQSKPKQPGSTHAKQQRRVMAAALSQRSEISPFNEWLKINIQSNFRMIMPEVLMYFEK